MKAIHPRRIDIFAASESHEGHPPDRHREPQNHDGRRPLPAQEATKTGITTALAATGATTDAGPIANARYNASIPTATVAPAATPQRMPEASGRWPLTASTADERHGTEELAPERHGHRGDAPAGKASKEVARAEREAREERQDG